MGHNANFLMTPGWLQVKTQRDALSRRWLDLLASLNCRRMMARIAASKTWKEAHCEGGEQEKSEDLKPKYQRPFTQQLPCRWCVADFTKGEIMFTCARSACRLVNVY